MPELASLRIHPVKGCAGIEVDAFDLEPDGPRLDREWMIVDARGVFVSQRELPQLALVRPALGADALQLDAPGRDALRVPLQADAAAAPDGRRRRVRCWRDDIEAVDAGDLAAQWLEGLAGRPLRLVRIARPRLRPVAAGHASVPATTRFTDGFPLLLAAESSLEVLSRACGRALAIERFRPNLVVRGSEAFEEDGWRRIAIGDVEIELVKPCARCVVTTVDPLSGRSDPGSEPLATLARLRTRVFAAPDGRRERGAFFGVNGVHRSTGRLRTGEGVRVLERGAPPFAEPG